MMQFPYFSGDQGGSSVESLLWDPQDVLRKKSALLRKGPQSSVLAFRAREVCSREACTTVSLLFWCPLGFPWNVGVSPHPRMPSWAFLLLEGLRIYNYPTTDYRDLLFLSLLSWRENGSTKMKLSVLRQQSATLLIFWEHFTQHLNQVAEDCVPVTRQGGQVTERERGKCCDSCLKVLLVTELKLRECFLLWADRKHSAKSDFIACVLGSSDCPVQMSSRWVNRFLRENAVCTHVDFSVICHPWMISEI